MALADQLCLLRTPFIELLVRSCSASFIHSISFDLHTVPGKSSFISRDAYYFLFTLTCLSHFREGLAFI